MREEARAGRLIKKGLPFGKVLCKIGKKNPLSIKKITVIYGTKEKAYI
jgi:hypothetical protein